MNADTEPIDSRLRRALCRRADAVEPSPASYARLAERVSEDTSRVRWWVAPGLWALGLASVIAIAAVSFAAIRLEGGSEPTQIIVAGPDPTAEPTETPPAAVTPDPSATPTATDVSDPLAPWAGRAQQPIWPLGDSSSWPATPADAARQFLLVTVGQELPTTLLEPSSDGGAVTAQIATIGESGQPFGQAATLQLAGGLDASGQPRWAVMSVSSDEIVLGDVVVGADGTVTPVGVGRAFEGTFSATVVLSDGTVIGDGLVMGGGTERLPLDGSARLASNPGGPAYLVLADLGGLGVAPVSFLVVPVQLPDPASSFPATCSAAGLAEPTPQDGVLSEAAKATRVAIARAAIDCDWEALFALARDAFTASFGGTRPEELWPTLEANGEAPLRYLVELLSRPYAPQDVGVSGILFTWPSAFQGEWSEVPVADKEALRPVYGDEDFAAFEEFGAYIGYRVGIAEDGTWQFFVAGD